MAKKNSKKQVQADAKKHQEILLAFRKKRILNLITTLVIFGAAFFAFWFSNNRTSIQDENTRTLIVAAICILSLGALGFSVYNWRCPACGKHLGGGIDPQRCRKCGYRFR